eukprot:COSAG06_NODE_66_length_26393_cov_6.455161_16_plen_277_part_00
MTTLFKSPQIGEPRATGVKNGGVQSYDQDMRDEQDMDPDDDARSGFADLSENRNPKQEIIRAAHRTDPTAANSPSASGEFEVSEPIWLSSMQHGYFVAGGDHQLTMTIGQHFATDLFYSCETNTIVTERGGTSPNYTYTPTVHTNPAYTNVIAGVLPDPTKLTSKTVYVQITGVELHCAMAGPAIPTIPPSVSLKFSDDYDPTILPNAAKHQEDVCMKALRRAGHPLLNKNCAMDANEERRLASKRWRDAHPGYMAQKSRDEAQLQRLSARIDAAP